MCVRKCWSCTDVLALTTESCLLLVPGFQTAGRDPRPYWGFEFLYLIWSVADITSLGLCFSQTSVVVSFKAYTTAKGSFTLTESERNCECEHFVQVWRLLPTIGSNWKSISWRRRFNCFFGPRKLDITDRKIIETIWTYASVFSSLPINRGFLFH